jgi:c-di-GMP-binding flagellar brake protein YcgR
MFRKNPPSVSATSKMPSKAIMAQRRYFRASVDIAVTYNPGDETPRVGRIDDLSGGGVRLETAEDLPAGTNLALTFDLFGTPVTATGRVVMSFFDGGRKLFLHGVAFAAIDPAQQDAILIRVTELQAGGSPS